MQLAAFNNNNFTLGHASMMINEGLPLYMVSRLEQRVRPVGDDGRDPRDGVQGGVRRHPLEPELQAQAAAAVPRRRACSAPTRTRSTTRISGRSPTCSPKSDLLVIATPHRQYADLDVDVPVVDVWNLLGNGERV